MADEIENNDELDLDGGDELQVTPPEKKETSSASPELASILSELSGNVKALATPKEKEQEVQMTEEQKAEYWGVYDPEKADPDFFRKFLRLNTDLTPEEITKAVAEFKPIFGAMQKGLMKQAIVGAMRMVEARLKERDEKNAPIHEYVSQSRARELRTRFNEAYPVLADKKYDKVIRFFAKEQEGKNFKSEEEFFKTLAESVAEHIKSIDETFDLGAEVQTAKTKIAGTPPKLPRGGAGGGGGAGGRDTSAVTNRSKDYAEDVLG